MTATLQSTTLAAKVVTDVASMLDVRRQNLGEQAALSSAMDGLPTAFSDISDANFGALWHSCQPRSIAFS